MTRRKMIEDAKKRGHLVIGRDTHHDARNEWWRVTEAEGRPYVWMRPGRAWDLVVMDLFHYPKLPTLEAIRAAVDEVDSYVQTARPMRPRQKRWIKGLYGPCVVSLKIPANYGARLAHALKRAAEAGQPRAER